MLDHYVYRVFKTKTKMKQTRKRKGPSKCLVHIKPDTNKNNDKKTLCLNQNTFKKVK